MEVNAIDFHNAVEVIEGTYSEGRLELATIQSHRVEVTDFRAVFVVVRCVRFDPRSFLVYNPESIMKPYDNVLALLLAVFVGSILANVSVELTVVGADDSVRIHVRVPPREIGRRAKNEMPAEFRITADDLPSNRRLDPSS